MTFLLFAFSLILEAFLAGYVFIKVKPLNVRILSIFIFIYCFANLHFLFRMQHSFQIFLLTTFFMWVCLLVVLTLLFIQKRINVTMFIFSTLPLIVHFLMMYYFLLPGSIVTCISYLILFSYGQKSVKYGFRDVKFIYLLFIVETLRVTVFYW